MLQVVDHVKSCGFQFPSNGKAEKTQKESRTERKRGGSEKETFERAKGESSWWGEMDRLALCTAFNKKCFY